MALVLEAKPTARRDIISAILSHYGDERDLDLDDHDDVLAAYCQASPTPGPLDRSSKPLPSVPLTQLRDRGRGMHRMASDDSTQEPRARIMAPRSLSRSKRPPELRLVKSNGSTATSAKTPSQSSSPPADSPSRQHPERGRRHARGRLDDELPLPPPPPELPDKSDNDTMGSSKSKLPQDERSSPRRLHFSLRRKPVKKPSPAVADPPAPPPATQLHETKVQPSQEPPPAPPPKLQKVKSDEALMSSSSASKHARGPSNAVSEPVTSNERHHAPEPSDDTVVRIRRERSNTPPSEPDQNEPITPPLKPGQPVQLLPSPTPVPEESPSKWGLTKKPSNSSAMANDVDPKANLHFRGKSSTGFDIFKHVQ
ncbi:hypothetical protein IWX90DRAFT_272458 [Phyllosticta citrichinensis]|uniref:Uncharacterized protein n=1 Tax=Phyllosticta citrichinensis TaxID=1130410 RepID=A0ABR1XMT6_9PEZI